VIARRIVVALLALVAVGVVVLVVVRPGVDPQPTRQQLDEPAVAACEVFEPAAAQVRAGELEGEPLFRVLQDTFNQARLSDTPGFAQQVAELNSAAINDDQQTLRQGVLALQLRCQQRRG
jgi:hypothetical protein